MSRLKPIKKENLSLKVYHEIRNALMDGQYEPGERLIISDLAQDMGVSITPVREAIFRLISEQGLEMQAATAVYVPYTDSKKLAEIQQLRFFLEGFGAGEAARHITRKQLNHLKTLQKEFLSCTSHDPKRASHLNRQFHFALLEAAQKPVLRSTVESFWVIIGPVLKIFHIQTAGLDYTQDDHLHGAILKALEAKDSEAATQAMQADITWGGQVMVNWLIQREQEDLAAHSSTVT